MQEFGRLFVVLGLAFLACGLILMALGRFGTGHILLPGHLPGDFAYRGKRISFFAPLGTSLLLSVLLSALFYLIFHRRR